MLVQFSVSNFGFFKETTAISMVASNYDKTTNIAENTLQLADYPNRLLKAAMVYGADTGGKDSLLQALMLFKKLAQGTGSLSAIKPFVWHTESRTQPSEFEIIFVKDANRYRYGFVADSSRVISEWLYFRPETKEIKVFGRRFQEVECHPVHFKKGQLLQKENLVRPNRLLLFVASQFNDIRSVIVTNQLQSIRVYPLADENQQLNDSLNESNKKVLLGWINKVDASVVDIHFQENEAIITRHIYDYRQHRVETIETFLSQESVGFRHSVAFCKEVLFALSYGQLLVSDWYGLGIHPSISAYMMGLFNHVDNVKGSQLIALGNNTHLLTGGRLRRDQIWFSEKNKLAEASLYSLADFKGVRKKEDFESNYFKGKYGSIFN